MRHTLSAWDTFGNFDVFLSEPVIAELKRTPSELKTEMMKAVRAFTVLSLTDEIHELAAEYIVRGIFPQKYYDDALHVAVASVNRIGVLLSWNFTHLVKIKTRRMVALVNTMKDYPAVEIISPPEL
jgi:hypothetical protein